MTLTEHIAHQATIVANLTACLELARAYRDTVADEGTTAFEEYARATQQVRLIRNDLACASTWLETLNQWSAHDALVSAHDK